ncbi:MAG TPA: helix-turn-helix transcriptional regulator [Phycisphaerae bacterium]|nr:helix-turn-helix transcriptional regulator [Phycisphaerae bacterium]HRW54032.1 helix-turn-helix transcriptional regulator [Phycisphaerae bacterium]
MSETLKTSLLDAIERDGRTLNALAIDAGVSYSILYRFVTGERRTITLDVAERLCVALGLKLKPDRKGP